MTAEHFEGHENRDCGEHRTTGPRAWCIACGEWCYRSAPCKGCEIPVIYTAIERLEAAIDRVRALHQNVDSLGVCAECVYIDADEQYPLPWPCPTVIALDQPDLTPPVDNVHRDELEDQ